VGSVTEEAAALLAALSGFAREQGGQYAGAAAGAADAASSALHDMGDHIATGSAECTWCPICQVIHAVRTTSPEVRAHLAQAATSLVQAAASALATHAPEPTSPMEKIHLDDDGEDDRS
jgi:hypothetical protein